MKNGELFERTAPTVSEQPRADRFDQASAFENLWQNIRQTKVTTAKGRSCAPEPHHKQTAYRHYRRKVRSVADAARCLAALGGYRGSDRVKAGYIQDAGTFFNQWEEWEPEEVTVTMGTEPADDDAKGKADFWRPYVEEFIARYGDPGRSESARALFNEWASASGQGSMFAENTYPPMRDFWQQWRELVQE